MAQFDVHENPVPRARRAFPYLVNLQSDLIDGGNRRIVAPLVPLSAAPRMASRLAPVVTVDDVEHVVVMLALTTMPTTDLKGVRGNLSPHRTELVDAIDYVFLGV